MAVNWDNITIPFTSGVDRSKDDYLAAPGNVYTAQNLLLSSKNTLETHPGIDSVAAWSTRGSDPRCVAIPDGAVLVEFGHESYSAEEVAYRYAAYTSAGVTPSERTRADVPWRGGKATFFDADFIWNGYSVVAWVDDEEQGQDTGYKYVNVAVIDTSSDLATTLFRTTVGLATSGERVLGLRVCARGTSSAEALVSVRTSTKIVNFAVYYGASYAVTTTATLTGATAPVMADGSTPGACFDVVRTDGGKWLQVYLVAGTPHSAQALLWTFSAGAVAASALGTTQNLSVQCNTNISLAKVSSTYWFAYGSESGYVVAHLAGDGATTGVGGSGTAIPVACPHPGRVAFSRDRSSVSVALYWESHDAAFPAAPYVDAEYSAGTINNMQHYTSYVAIYYALFDSTGFSTPAATGLHGLISSLPGRVLSGTTSQEDSISITENDAYSPTQFLATKSSGNVLRFHSCVSVDAAVGMSADYVGFGKQRHGGRQPIPNLLQSAVGDWLVVHAPADGDVNPAYGDRKETISTPVLPYTASRSVRLTRIRRAGALTSCQAVGTTWMAGSRPKQVSSGAIGDEIVAPPVLYGLAVAGSLTENLTASTNYLICATFLVPDGAGNYVESAPSPAWQFYGSAVGNFTVYLRSSATANVSGCKVRLYRTSGTDLVTFYLDSEYIAAHVLAGNPMSAGTHDSYIASSVVLYTQRGEAVNSASPICHDIVEHQNRLFCTDGSEIRLTKPLSIGIGPRWFPRSVRIDVPDTFGKAVKLISMDEKLLVFCEKKIGVVDGGGPTLDGQGATFSELSEVSTLGTPVDSLYSFVQTDDGVWWKSSRGIRLLTRGYQVAKDDGGEVGRQVDGVLFFNYANAQTLPYYSVQGAAETAGVVRWFLRDVSGNASPLGIAFHKGAFTTFDMPASSTGVCAVAPASSVAAFYATRSGLHQIPTAGPTSTQDRSPTLGTGWLQLGSDIQDFSRIRKLVVTGQTQALYGYTGTLSNKAWLFTVKVWYDMLEGTSASVTEVTASAAAPKYESQYGGEWYNFRFEVPLSVQKCSAVRFEITATPNSWAKGLRFTGMTLEVGRKRGLAKKFSSTERK